MRPYQLYKDGPWLDLDTVQSIVPPKFVDQMGFGGYFAEMYWQHAFQDKPNCLRWNQEWHYADEARHHPTPDLDERGRPDAVGRMHKEVFIPFWEAWTGKEYLK